MDEVMMNATSFYVSTCRLILEAKADDPSTYSNLHQLFPCLRQSLSCSVCENLLFEPYTPIDGQCQHHVCKTCKGGRKKLRSTCSWCKDYGRYSENVELRTLLQCYKKLCHYITTTNIYRSLCSSNNGQSSESNKALIEIIKEGSGFKDDFKFRPNLNSTSSANCFKSTSTQTLNVKTEGEKAKGNHTENGETTYSVISTNNGNRLTFKRTAKDVNDVGQRNGNADKADVKVNKVRKRSVFTKPPTCKCGQNAPAKGTCRGYRCPCYTADKPCSPECNCVACKNPRGTPPPKDENSTEVSTGCNTTEGESVTTA